jgi:hypothetical protein
MPCYHYHCSLCGWEGDRFGVTAADRDRQFCTVTQPCPSGEVRCLAPLVREEIPLASFQVDASKPAIALDQNMQPIRGHFGAPKNRTFRS